ncbi:hypothetical protein [Photobacterium damselae]
MKDSLKNWMLPLLVGVLLGSGSASGYFLYQQQGYDAHSQKLEQQIQLEQQKQLQQQQEFTEDLANKTSQFEQLVAKLNDELKEQKESSDRELAKLQQKITSLQQSTQKLTVTKKKLDTRVVQLKTETKQQQHVISNSQALFTEKANLQGELTQIKSQITQLKGPLAKQKKACDEFKSGTSWNWVSQADCDKYNTMNKEVVALEQKSTLISNRLEQLEKLTK